MPSSKSHTHCDCNALNRDRAASRVDRPWEPDLEHPLSGTSFFRGVSTLETESITVLRQTEAYIAEVTGIDPYENLAAIYHMAEVSWARGDYHLIMERTPLRTPAGKNVRSRPR